VNDTFFTIEDILVAAAPRLLELPRGLTRGVFRVRAATVLGETLQEEIGRTLVLEEARARLTEEQLEQIEAAVDDTLKAMVAESGGSRKLLEQKLIHEGTTLERVLDLRRRALTTQSYLRMKFAPSIRVNRRMMLEYYRAHPEEFSSEKRVQMQIISAPVEAFLPAAADAPSGADLAAARKNARQHIDRAAEALRGGADFADVARKMSKGAKASSGGVWPLMPAGSFRRTEVERAAFALEAGQVSDVIETDEGFFLVKAKRVEPASRQSFAQAQEAIEEKLTSAQQRRLVNEYFERLHEKATVSHSESLMDVALDRAVERYWRR
jgi:hypothetical protein